MRPGDRKRIMDAAPLCPSLTQGSGAPHLLLRDSSSDQENRKAMLRSERMLLQTSMQIWIVSTGDSIEYVSLISAHYRACTYDVVGLGEHASWTFSLKLTPC
jgi:hypothetical protein